MVGRYHTTAALALATPEVRRRLGDLGMEIVGGSPEEATKLVMTQAARAAD